MKAVVLHEYGGPEKLKFEDNVPEPQMSGGTVVIATAVASVNPIDWKLRSGMRQKDSPLSFPAILGRDVSGVVRAVGANVKHFKAGDRVLALSNATYAELQIVTCAISADHFTEQKSAAVAQLWRESAELMATIGLCNRRGTLGNRIARKHRDAVR